MASKWWCCMLECWEHTWSSSHNTAQRKQHTTMQHIRKPCRAKCRCCEYRNEWPLAGIHEKPSTWSWTGSTNTQCVYCIFNIVFAVVSDTKHTKYVIRNATLYTLTIRLDQVVHNRVVCMWIYLLFPSARYEIVEGCSNGIITAVHACAFGQCMSYSSSSSNNNTRTEQSRREAECLLTAFVAWTRLMCYSTTMNASCALPGYGTGTGTGTYI